MQEFNEKEFNELMKAKKSALIVFSAPWCGACKLITPVIEKIAADTKHESITFAKVDVGKENALSSKMGVMSIPNTMFIKEGKVLDQLIGNADEKTILLKLAKI